MCNFKNFACILQGSNGLIILSSQTGGQISILNNHVQQQQHNQQQNQNTTQPSQHTPPQQQLGNTTQNGVLVEGIPQNQQQKGSCSAAPPVSVGTPQQHVQQVQVQGHVQGQQVQGHQVHIQGSQQVQSNQMQAQQAHARQVQALQAHVHMQQVQAARQLQAAHQQQPPAVGSTLTAHNGQQVPVHLQSHALIQSQHCVAETDRSQLNGNKDPDQISHPPFVDLTEHINRNNSNVGLNLECQNSVSSSSALVGSSNGNVSRRIETVTASTNAATHSPQDASMEVAHASALDSFSCVAQMDTQMVGTPDKNSGTYDLVNSLNLKNEQLHNFSDNPLQMSTEEIQQTLQANLGSTTAHDSQDASVSTGGAAANHQTVLDNISNIESLHSDMVSPSNLDPLFEILGEIPDLDSDTVTSDMSSTPTPSSGFDVNLTSTTAAINNSTTSLTNGNAPNNVHSKQLTQPKVEPKDDNSRAGIANITDFSPEWSYPEGGVKILVTGPWYATQSPYTILFDGVSVAAELVQSGVLRCFCPGHSPGVVNLQVACEGYIISNTCGFEYRVRESAEGDRQKEWFKVPGKGKSLRIWW